MPKTFARAMNDDELRVYKRLYNRVYRGGALSHEESIRFFELTNKSPDDIKRESQKKRRERLLLTRRYMQGVRVRVGIKPRKKKIKKICVSAPSSS